MAFILAKPVSKFSPIILSQSITRLIALAMKLFLPDILQVTLVSFVATGSNVNSASAVPANGLTKSSRIFTRSSGLLSAIVMPPSPTSALPDQKNLAPTPDSGPSNRTLALGSNLIHGDQASHLWKSLTWANTVAGGAAIVAERETWKSVGRVAMKIVS